MAKDPIGHLVCLEEEMKKSLLIEEEFLAEEEAQGRDS